MQQVAHMANACLGLIREKKADGLEKLCLRTMVGCIVLYDCVHPKGVFGKESPVKIKIAVQLLVRDFKKEYPNVDLTPLINVVKVCKTLCDVIPTVRFAERFTLRVSIRTSQSS